MSIHVKLGGVWRNILYTYSKSGGVWRRLLAKHVKQAVTWRNAITLSTPAAPVLSQINNSDGTYSLSGGSFNNGSAPYPHLNTDWQITTSSDTGFSSPVYSSLENSSNKTSINLHDKGLSSSSRLIARARYKADDGGVSEWSATYTVYTPPSVTFNSTAYNSHSYSITSYSGLSATHSNSDYLLTANNDTSFSSPGYSVTSQSATSYSRSDQLKGNSTYRIRVRANFSDGRSSPYLNTTVSTGNYIREVTYTSNTTITTPIPDTTSGVTVYVEVAGGRGGGSCQNAGRGRVFGMNLTLSGNTNYYAYPNGVSGGGGAACGGAGGSAAVFATTTNQAYLIGGGGGGVLQCCHCCNCNCDGCGGGAGSTSSGGGACGSCCGCGSNGSTWGGSRLGGGSTDGAESGNNNQCCGGCGGGNSHAYGSLSTNTLNNGGPYVYIRW
jgi:hypothetical protein